MIKEGRSCARIENVHPNPDNKFLQNLAPGIVRGAAPQGAVCIRVHRAYIRYIVGIAVVNAGCEFQRDLIE